MSQVPVCTLILNGANASKTNAAKSVITWSNINLRTLLGSLYDQYDYFNLCLNNVATAPSVTNFYFSTSDLQVLLRITGLPFINNTYNITSTGNTQTGSAIISNFTFANGTYASTSYSGLNILTFGKTQEQCDLTIDYLRVNDFKPVQISASNTFPITSFIFTIYGIPKEKGNENATRMIK